MINSVFITFLTFLLLSSSNLSYSNEVSLHLHEKEADIIVFSFNRPLQLYAYLESVHKYFSNFNEVYVLYRTTSNQFDIFYDEIKAVFPKVKFAKQGNNPRGDFKPLLLECFYGSPAEYIIFSVDDDIIKDYVDLAECISALEDSNAYAFYLRLGTNISLQYGQNLELKVPEYKEIKPSILKFKFKDGMGDWAYPNALDTALFKKSKIENFFKNAHYTSPNTLESAWSGAADLDKYGLCFRVSKKFTLPLNIVQQDWYVANENSFSIDELALRWKNGLKMDIDQFYQANNNCAFMGYVPNFIKR